MMLEMIEMLIFRFGGWSPCFFFTPQAQSVQRSLGSLTPSLKALSQVLNLRPSPTRYPGRAQTPGGPGTILKIIFSEAWAPLYESLILPCS